MDVVAVYAGVPNLTIGPLLYAIKYKIKLDANAKNQLHIWNQYLKYID